MLNNLASICVSLRYYLGMTLGLPISLYHTWFENVRGMETTNMSEREDICEKNEYPDYDFQFERSNPATYTDIFTLKDLYIPMVYLIIILTFTYFRPRFLFRESFKSEKFIFYDICKTTQNPYCPHVKYISLLDNDCPHLHMTTNNIYPILEELDDSSSDKETVVINSDSYCPIDELKTFIRNTLDNSNKVYFITYENVGHDHKTFFFTFADVLEPYKDKIEFVDLRHIYFACSGNLFAKDKHVFSTLHHCRKTFQRVKVYRKLAHKFLKNAYEFIIQKAEIESNPKNAKKIEKIEKINPLELIKCIH